jgi:hypothetical protein
VGRDHDRGGHRQPENRGVEKIAKLAWRRIADPLLTPFERREIRNHIKESDLALRYYLTMMSKRLRFHPATVCKCRQ